MGNVSTRKRPAEKDDEPSSKRMRFSAEPQYQEIRFNRLRYLRRRNRDANRPSGQGTSVRAEVGCTKECKEEEKEEVEKDSPYSPKKDCPLPWFDLLFLPEFPTRSIINEKSFSLERQLGRGSFGTVYCASACHDVERKFAIKVQRKSDVISRHAVLQVRREANIQRLLPSHPFVARIYCTWQSRTKLFSVLQYPQGSRGDLFSVWRDRGSLPEAAIRLIAAELACALDFLHRHDVIYRDVKLENIVVDADGHVLLVDFGLAKKLNNGQYTNTICGTLQYMSPDVSSGRPYSHFVDWWSLAVLLHVLYTGIYPYPNAEATHHSDLKFIDYSTPLGCSIEFGNLMDRMLCVNPHNRLCSFTVFHAHPFFSSLSFQRIEDKLYKPIDAMSSSCQYDEAIEVDDEFKSFDENYEFDRNDYFDDRY